MEIEKTEIKNKSKLPKLLLKLTVSLSLIAFLLSRINLNNLVTTLKTLDQRYIPIVIAFIVANYIISSMRWKNLFTTDASKSLSLNYYVHLYFIGSFFNNFMPTSIGGDVYKIYKLGHKTGDNARAFAATFMERFLGVIALVVISLVGLISNFGFIAVLSLAILALGTVVSFSLLKFLSGRLKAAAQIYQVITAYTNHKKVIFWAFIYSFVVQFFAIFSQYYVFASIHEFPPIGYALMVLPVITLASFFIPSLNGIGVQDALFISMFSVVGVTTEAAISASILYHIVRLVVSLFGGILYALGYDE